MLNPTATVLRKFRVKFLREFEVEIEAESGEMATQISSSILAQFPKDTCKLLSVIAEDYVEQPCAGCAADPLNPSGKPRGNPTGGGSPGTPTVKTPPLVDQVAEAA